MKADKIIQRNFSGLTIFVPHLIDRPRCHSFNPRNGCLYCGNKTFRFHSKAGNKKYYQCEKCWGLNH
jgi:hypothetical protein